ncbi:MAG: four helix bundle protein [Planctomycetes bacterium]|nr:four helix bundle protein [Planctomycetota bacterium]
MTPAEMKARTKEFALRIIKLVDALPFKRSAEVIGRQVLRSGTAIGANYRSACRAQSPRDFIKKMGYVEEEADETQYWLELLVDAGIMRASRLAGLIQEAGEITAIAAASRKTARRVRMRTRQK